MTVRKLKGSAIQTGTITSTQLSGALNSSISAGGGPKISNIIYPGDDTAANTTGGQTVYIVGSGFAANAIVYINGNSAPSVSFISSSNLQITTPALSAASYPVYVINPEDGGTAIKIPGLVISGEPTWSTSATLPEQGADDAWSISLSATSDSSVTYALADGSSLPSGISLAANGLISGTLSSPPNDDTTYNFTVVASDAENQDASRAFSVTVTTGEGVAFANTVLLLHGDGTNNQNNHTFLDSSNNNFTITRNGNATQGSFSPFSQTGWSGYFDGSGDYIRKSGSGVLTSSGDVTIECWAYPLSSSVIGLFDGGPSETTILRNYPANNIQKQGGNSISFTMTQNAWNHLALTVTSGGTATLYINGTSVGTSTFGSYSGGSNFDIGTINGGGDGAFNGYISNFRVTKSIVYIENFTPSTSPLTAIANTSLLTLQSNRFIDNSTNAYTLARNGDTKIIPFSPFAPTVTYSTAAVGGSAYFDGSGDYLTTTMPALSTGSFTVEFWFHPTNPGLAYLILDKGFRDGNFSLQTDYLYSGIFYLNVGGTTYTISFTPPIVNQWNHIAICRDSSSLRFFLNGVQLGTTQTNSGDVTTGTLYIGAASTTGSGYSPTQGYISNLRITTTALYTSNFTPSTTPLTNIANTSLLLNFTNAGIFDSTAKNVLETVGDAKVSTSVVKYGTGSINIPSTDATVKMLGVDLLADFTIEGWAKPAISGGERFFILQGINVTNGFLIALTTSQILWRSNGTTDISAGISKADWYHFAIVRSGSGSNNVKVYVDGSQVTQGTYTNTILASAGTLNIGPGGALNPSFASYGYIDDFRISRFARYTSNFTPPTAAFKDR